MPKCVVRKCPHRTGKKFIYPQIVLHPFPKNIMLIQDWLRLAGMQEENLELVSSEILEDKRSDKFRMCSAHFTQDSYIFKGSKRVLKVDAMPSKFPEISVLDFAHPPILHKITKRAQTEQSLAMSADGRPVKAKCNCKCHMLLKSRLVNSSTQTEASDFLIPVSVDPYIRLAGQQNLGMDTGNTQTLEQGLSTAETATAIKVPPCQNIIPVKKWKRTDFQLQQERNHNENGFLSSKDTKSHVEPSTQDEEMVSSDESPFEIVTVEDWEIVADRVKQENFQNENGVLGLSDTDSYKEKSSNDMPPLLIKPNQKREDYFTENKKDVIGNGGSLEKANVVPSFSEHPIENMEGDKTRVKEPCKKSISVLNENSDDDVSDATKPKRRKNDEDANMSDPSNSSSDEEDATSSTPPLSLDEKYAKEKKYVVFESCLDVLLLNMRCQQKYCSERIKQYHKQTVGSLLVVYATCCRGHNFKLWESQPRVNGVGAGNVLLATLLVLTGSSFSKIKGLCDIIALQIFSKSSFHRYEEKYIFPSIDQWIQEEDESEIVHEVEEEDTVLDKRKSV
ncbi:uncharacterized protein [Pyxicephalus adspersus]|uniref:uncharacterized protein n=1 Tax=Pyxicephalus adspersus TaxID=30357 RepID=UPI003B5A459C